MRLRLVYERTDLAEDPFEAPTASSPRGRPGDVRDPWTVPGAACAAFERACERAGAAVAAGAAVVVERALIVRHLQRLGAGGLVASLDEEAAVIRIDAELAPADALYLRTLTAGATPRSGMVIPLPARLATRVLREGGPAGLLDCAQLEPALAWERAAVASGFTMTEWAFSRAQPVAER